MKIYRYLLPILLATAVACEHADPEPGNAGNGNTETPGDDLLGGGDVDMSEWPDYTKPEMSASGPSVVVYTQNKSTVNGKPFIPMAIYGVNQGDMADVAGYGFNLIQSYQVTPDDMDNIRNWLDEAQQHGLMGCVNLDGAELDAAKVEKIKEVVRTFKDHPALYAWYYADEPKMETTPQAEYIELYRWIKSEDGNHPVIASNWELNNFTDGCDVDMRQFYDGIPSNQTPKLESYLSGYGPSVKTWVAIINSYHSNWSGDGDQLNPTSLYSGLTEGTPEWTAAETQAQFIIDNMKDPEAAGLKFSSDFPKTPLLIRSSLYWAFVHGSNGLYYWLYSNKDNLNKRWGWYTVFHYPAAEAAIAPVLDEFARLSKFLVNPGSSAVTFTAGESVHVWSRIVDNRRVIIAVNESLQDYDEDIDLSELYIPGRTLEVYNNIDSSENGRETALDGNILSGETFEANEVKVYFVK